MLVPNSIPPANGFNPGESKIPTEILQSYRKTHAILSHLPTVLGAPLLEYYFYLFYQATYDLFIVRADVYDHMEYISSSLDMFAGITQGTGANASATIDDLLRDERNYVCMYRHSSAPCVSLCQRVSDVIYRAGVY